VADWSAHIADTESEETQGRDIPRTPQATGLQGFGRDIGATGLTQDEREGRGFSAGKAVDFEHKLWAAALSRLGGSSPGSAENLQLAEKFAKVQFPSDQQGVISHLEPGAEFRIREGISVDLKDSVEKARVKVFRNLGDLVDAVKDELRRQEAAGKKLMKTV
ncbi:MAG TPA: hypothetical protein VK465_09220, partial [Fibrobacteria bacterium]|nr:hypothetical protein [Fibrobacteria bacterium]